MLLPMHLALPSDAFNEFERRGGDLRDVDMAAVERVYEGAWLEATSLLTLGRIWVGLVDGALFGEHTRAVAAGALVAALGRDVRRRLEAVSPSASVDEVCELLRGVVDDN